MNTEQKIEAGITTEAENFMLEYVPHPAAEWSYNDERLFDIGKAAYIAGRSAGLEREKEYREFIEEVSKVSYSPFSDEVFKIREKAKQLLNK